jgi:DNA ligase-1
MVRWVLALLRRCLTPTVHDEGAGRSRDFILIRTPRGEQDHWLFTQKRVAPLDQIEKHGFALREEDRLKELEETGEYIAEVKMDGSHELLHINEHGIRLTSHRVSKRDGMLIEHSDKVPHLRDIRVPGYDGTVMHGELWHPKGANFVAGVLNSSVARARHLQQQHGPLRVKVFDLKTVGGINCETQSYGERRLMAMAIIAMADTEHIHYIRGTRSNFGAFYERVNEGREFRYKNHPSDGVVLKRMGASYKESPWYKVKPVDDHDLTVVGVTEEHSVHGEPKGSLGALVVETPEGKRVNVGSGFTRTQREWLWEHREELPGEVAMVRFHARDGQKWTGPRFVNLHPGKSSLAGLQELQQ